MANVERNGTPDNLLTEYHYAYPEQAEQDLQVFRSLCEGNVTPEISAECDCNHGSVASSLNRLNDYLTSGNMLSIVEIFRYIFFKTPSRIPSASSMDSVIDTLYAFCSESGMVPYDVTEKHFSCLYNLLDDMSPETADKVCDVIYNLCDVFERASFAEGVKVGYQLGKELCPN